MMSINLIDLIAIAFAAIVGAGVILFLLGRFGRHRSATRKPADDDLTFLFDGKTLIDANADAKALIEHHAQQNSDFDAMITALGTQFPQLAETIDDATQGVTRLYAVTDPAFRVDVECRGQITRITLNNRRSAGRRSAVDAVSQDMRDAEIALMRDVSNNIPQLIWQQNRAGKVIWSNAAYSAFCKTRAADDKPLFADLDLVTCTHRKICTAGKDTQKQDWFDVTTVVRDDHLLCFATDATALMRADNDRRNFVQTLGKTFAQLSIGLAIFDKDRQLAMFNPALLDMTKLPVDFLSARPAIDTVLDRLRELRMMPEPKDYTTWRDRFTAVETAAKNGTYSENWALPDGQTYRVTGRPHPDGAFAFLFEDISAEVSLNRRFRSDIQTGQAVLDSLSEAIAVFSDAGTLVMSNQSYARLWTTNPDLSLDRRLKAEMEVWQKNCMPSQMWVQMRDFIEQVGTRKPWSDDAVLSDGRRLHCQANPISGGMTLVRFAIGQPVRPVIRKLSPPQPVVQAEKA